MDTYNHKNCQSLFGYAANVHIRSGGKCQLCGCGGKGDFHLWRQMTVEHLIGKSQGGYLHQIRDAVAERFPDMSPDDQENLSQCLDQANTVSACSFCNSTTSRTVSQKSMTDLLQNTKGAPQEVLREVKRHLRSVLKGKQADVKWRLDAVEKAYQEEVHPRLTNI